MLLQKSIVIITGASGGYGCELAKCFAQQLPENSLLLLNARNEGKLDVTLELINPICKRNGINVKSVLCDFSNSEDVNQFMKKCIENVEVSQYKTALFIHNAGSLGDVTLKIDQYSDRQVISEYMDLNVSNVLFLTTQFLSEFSSKLATCCIVNISSLCGIQPTPSCGLYCAGKAARDMMFKVLAIERPDVRVLNWAPGPMLTKMSYELMNSCDEKIADTFKDMYVKENFVKCGDSVKKMIGLLMQNKFKSGDHLDYYDV